MAYLFDKDFNVRKVTHSVWSILWKVFKWVVATFSLAAIYYILFALVFDSAEEKQLKRENRMYEKLYPEMVSRERLVSDVIEDLKYRDDAIYRQVFHTDAPSVDKYWMDALAFPSDTIPDKDLVDYSERKVDSLFAKADAVGTNLREIYAMLCSDTLKIPPMTMPVKDLGYAQVGASVGQKYNPFYKVGSAHYGIDLISGQGNAVYASAPGEVISVIRSGKGLGNVVEIAHDGGYVTRYGHLADIVVRKGERVTLGKKLGNVGISGNTFAPHLHYEVLKGDSAVNPINYFFATFTPMDYINAAYMSVNTEQSLD